MNARAARGCFITGTDTDAGKTVIVSALLRSFRQMGVAATAIKPVQTGCQSMAGQMRAPDVDSYLEAARDSRAARALRRFEPACSPHLAARLANTRLEAASLVSETRAAMAGAEFALVEGAGGILAPLNEKEAMLDLMTGLRLPVILAIPNKLGCINQALLSMRMLRGSGLDVKGFILSALAPADSLLMEENRDFLARRGLEQEIPLLCELPYLADLQAPDKELRADAWQRLARFLEPVAELLLNTDSLSGGASLLEDDKKFLWHPYAGTEPAPTVFPVAGASGRHIFLEDGRKLLDGMSSWWCANLGYGRRDLLDALQHQAERLPHIMFGGFTHAAAVKLAAKLLSITPEGLEKVFFADSGSVAVEVALKMAIQYQLAKGFRQRQRICAFRGAYHGDTLGAMSVCDPVNGMHSIFRSYLPSQLFLERPAAPFGGIPDKTALAAMEATLREHSGELAAVVVEPVAQGAGGMWFYHPSYLEMLRNICAELDIVFIADEIATGFGRTGKLFACEWAGISPDIMCLGKALTGGMMSFSAVLCKGRIAKAISNPADPGLPAMILHGPTFMANPLACAVALKAVESLLEFPWRENVLRLEKRLAAGLEPCRSLPGVADVRVLGAIGVVEMAQPVNTDKLQAFFVNEGVWIRPFNRLIYVMPPFTATNEEADELAAAICRACENRIHI